MIHSVLRTFSSSAAKITEKFKNNREDKRYRSLLASKINPADIPKYVTRLEKPPVYQPYIITDKNNSKVPGTAKIKRHIYYIDILELKQQILPEGYPPTTVWGYGGLIKDPLTGHTRYSKSSPGATFEAIQNVPVMVSWVNRLKNPHLFAVDPTLHWANPNHMPMEPPKPWPAFPPGFYDAQRPVPVVIHLHGGEVPSVYDGHPEAWFTCNGKTGDKFRTATYTYPNSQEAATLWYHDHALGITRLNLYAGLAGFYLLRRKKPEKTSSPQIRKFSLPDGKYEIPLLIQDRSFREDGSLLFHNAGNNPEVHPYWMPEFFGDIITVNGKTWPNLDVERRQYRFRLLNGSNARFYNLKLSNGLEMTQIGSDGGFLPGPAVLYSLLLAPAERADILIDFSGMEPGTKILLLNDANAPYPGGNPPDPDTAGQIMQFTIPCDALSFVKPGKLPDRLNKLPSLAPDSPKRTLTLFEANGTNGALELLLNGQKWSYPISETPSAGSTEEWDIVNLTPDTHPIHLHLVQFRLLNRQFINTAEFADTWLKMNGMPPFTHPAEVPDTEPYLIGKPLVPDSNELGWKDTLRMNPGQVTRILVRFTPQKIPSGASKPGENLYPFDPSAGPGYVWHCHILDHEDNEMMRPYKVRNSPNRK